MFKTFAIVDEYKERKDERRKRYDEEQGLRMRTCPCCSGSGHYKSGLCSWCEGTGKVREDKRDQEMRLKDPEQYKEMNRSLRDRW